jgi:hypothetical protein
MAGGRSVNQSVVGAMADAVIPYGTSDARATRRLVKRISIGVATLAVLVFLVLTPLREVESRVDAVTGSISYKTTWFGVLRLGPDLRPSPLEVWARAMGVNWRSDWHLLSDVEYSLLGTSRGCSPAPPIYGMRPLMKPFVQNASEQEQRDFLQIMQTGSDAQQTAAVDAVVTKYLDSPDAFD